MYIYESHLDGLYVSNDKLDSDKLCCEECGDSDWLIGEANTQVEAWELLKELVNLNCNGGYDLEYVKNFIQSKFKDDKESAYLVEYTVYGIITAKSDFEVNQKINDEWDRITNESDFQSAEIQEI